MNNPFRRPPPPSTWERLTDPLRDPATARAGRTGLLGLAAVVLASAASAVVSSVRERQDDQ